METTANLKQAVRVWLAHENRTQEWLALQLGVSGSVFSRVLSGYSPLTDELVAGLRRVTGIDAQALREPSAEAQP